MVRVIAKLLEIYLYILKEQTTGYYSLSAELAGVVKKKVTHFADTVRKND